jgi:hypothetical protein
MYPLFLTAEVGQLCLASEIGGYNDVPDWPKMGPSLLIATCLIVAIRTAKWSATIDAKNSNCELG